ALPRVFLLHGPRPRPHRRILDGHGIFERGRARARPPLDQVQVLARALEIGLRAEIGHVDDERIALPVAARVAVPLADRGGQVRAAVHHDVALPALALADVVEHRDATRRLHDAAEAAAIGGAELGQAAGEAAVGQAAVLRAVVAVHARGVV